MAGGGARPAAGHGRWRGMTGGGAMVARWGGQEEDEGNFILFFVFKIFNWTDMWGPCPPQQKDFIFCHVGLTGGPIMSVSVSIRDQFEISAHCKLSIKKS
jgi:hypothetical protein